MKLLTTYRKHMEKAMYGFGVGALGAGVATGALLQEGLTAWAYIPALVGTFSAIAFADLARQVLPLFRRPRALTDRFPDHFWTGLTSMRGTTAPLVALGVAWVTVGVGLALLMLPAAFHTFVTSFLVSSTTGFLVAGWKNRSVETWARSIRMDHLTVTAAWHNYNGATNYYLNDTVYVTYPREELELEFERQGASVLQAALYASELYDAFEELQAKYQPYFRPLL